MALVKGKFVDKNQPVQSNNDPVDQNDLSRKGYVDQKASDEADAAEQAAKDYTDLKIGNLEGNDTVADLVGDLATSVFDAMANKVEKAGDTMTGPLTMDKNPIFVNDDQQNTIIGPAALSLTSFDEQQLPTAQTIILPAVISLSDGNGNASLPVNPENVTTKKYVDDQIAGIDLSTKADLVDGKVPSSQLPSFVDDVEEYASLGSFPPEGSAGKLYVAQDTNKIYRWSGTVYIEIVGSPGSTDAVPEGSVNLYFTDERAQAALASALSGKSDVGHTHVAANITDFASAASAAAPVQSVAGKVGEVSLVKGDVGLSNVDNTADLDKPISTATATALAGKVSKAGDTMTGELILQGGLTTLNPINGFDSGGEHTLTIAPEYAEFILRKENFQTSITPNYALFTEIDTEGSGSWKGITFIEKSSIYLYDENNNPSLPVEPAQVTTKAYVDAAIGALSGGLSGKKETFTLSAGDIANAYVDCAHLAAADTMLVMSGGVVHIEGESYTLSTVGGVTRITFIGDLVDPSPSKLEAGDKVYIQYMK